MSNFAAIKHLMNIRRIILMAGIVVQAQCTTMALAGNSNDRQVDSIHHAILSLEGQALLDAYRHVFPETHHFLRQQKSWNYYYSTLSLWANFLIFANEGSKAQNEVRNMYEDAKKRNNIYGIGLA